MKIKRRKVNIGWMLVLPSLARTGVAGVEPLSEFLPPLNDSGITSCSDFAYAGGVEEEEPNLGLDCNAVEDAQGDPIPKGQDGHSGRDVLVDDDNDGAAGFVFTKIGENGEYLLAEAAEWACVLDKYTGLMWEVKTDDGGLRDKDWTYSWFNSSRPAGHQGTENGGNCVDEESCDTTKYVEAVNAAGLCGFNDWSLPTRELLRTIVHYESPFADPSIDVDWYPNTVEERYWSSSHWALNSDYAWYVDFSIEYGGTSDISYTWIGRHVRLVRVPW